MNGFCSEPVSFILSVTSTLTLSNTLAYYEMRTLGICNVFVIQAPVYFFQKFCNKIPKNIEDSTTIEHRDKISADLKYFLSFRRMPGYWLI
jgi:hypothetical protein